MVSSKKIGTFIRKQRKLKQLTQKELASKLNLSFQAVSKWETGDTLPDVSILLELANILETTTDKLLSGGQIIQRKSTYIDVNDIAEGFKALENLRVYFGKDSSFYQGAIEGINAKMNIDFEQYMKDNRYKEVMFAEVIIQYLMSGYYMDLDEIKQFVKSEKLIALIGKYLGDNDAMNILKYEDHPHLFNQIKQINTAFTDVNQLNELPGEYIKMQPGKSYWGTQVETTDDQCFGIAVDEEKIYVFKYGPNGINQKLVHEELLEKKQSL
jgi:transcriptional regulator with XRE-family HTH domain